jgi:hypothetical protein
MSREYKGKIVILSPKTNSGIIVFDEGGKSEVIQFDPIYEDGDIVEVSFKDDLYKSMIDIIRTVPVTYFGRIIKYDKNIRRGQMLLCNPKLIGPPVTFLFSSISSNSSNKEYFSDVIQSGKFSQTSQKSQGSLIFNSYNPVNIKVSLVKNSGKYYVSNLEFIQDRNNEYFKCNPPTFGFYKNLKKTLNIGIVNKIVEKDNWFGFIQSELGAVYFDGKNIDSKPREGQKVSFEYTKKLIFDKRLGYKTEKLSATRVIPNHKINSEKDCVFEIQSDDDICFVYNNQSSKTLTSEIHKLNLNCISDLINCYKSSDDDVKIRIIDRLIESDSKIIKFDPATLKIDKIQILKRLGVNNRKYLVELQKLKYNPTELKNAGSGFHRINLESEEIFFQDSVQANNRINIDIGVPIDIDFIRRSPVLNIELEEYSIKND